MARTISTKTIVSRLLQESSQPVYVLNADHQFTFVNQALLQLVGTDEQNLLGQRAQYCQPPTALVRSTGSSGGFVPNDLSPPPVAWNVHCHHCVLSIVTTSGVVRREAICHRLGSDKKPTGLLVILSENAPVESHRENLRDAESLHEQLVELRRSWHEGYTLDRLVGKSSSMQRIRNQVRLATKNICRVTIVGPPRSGRETMARTIHRQRDRSGTIPLVPLSSPLVDPELLQATIESITNPSFDIPEDRQSTLLLMDVDQLSTEGQQLLAESLGVAADLLTICTSSRSLEALVAAGSFREDLAHYLTTLEIQIPPLCQRKDDIPLLAQWRVEELNRIGKKQIGGFDRPSMDMLVAHDWPGEMEEFLRVIAESHTAAVGPLISAKDLPAVFALTADVAGLPPPPEGPIQLVAFLEEMETELIRRALRRTQGNKARAARQLGISRPRLLRRIEQLHISTDHQTPE